VLLAGTAGGFVHVLDTRAGGLGRSAPADVRTFREHAGRYVVGVAQARTGSCYAVVSGSVAADVAFWDLRVDHSLRLVRSHARGAMTCLATHDFAPLLATGSLRQQVRVLTNAGEDVDDITHHESFGSDRLAPVTCVAFHPTKLMLAVGARDSLVSLRVAA
jgi:regulator-associated protein of mTOR